MRQHNIVHVYSPNLYTYGYIDICQG